MIRRLALGTWVAAGLWFATLVAHANPPDTTSTVPDKRSQYSVTEKPPVVSQLLMRTTQTWAGQPLTVIDGPLEVTALHIELAPKAETGWHLHPVPSFAYIIAGELEVTLEDGRKQRVRAGQAMAEVVDWTHNGRNVGDDPVQLVVFYLSAPGGELTRLQSDNKP